MLNCLLRSPETCMGDLVELIYQVTWLTVLLKIMSIPRRQKHSLYLTSRKKKKKEGLIPFAELKEFFTFKFHIFLCLHYCCSYSHLLSPLSCAIYVLGNVKYNFLVSMPGPSSISIFLATCYLLECPADTSHFVSHSSLLLPSVF